MSAEPSETLVKHNLERTRFEAEDGAYLSYAHQGDKVIFDHTYVPTHLRGKGVAAVLARAALTEARSRNWKIVPACSYVATFIDRYPEFKDLLA